MKPEQERLKAMLTESVTLMCRNGLPYKKEMRIEAVIGITLDNDDVVLVHINEKYDNSREDLHKDYPESAQITSGIKEKGISDGKSKPSVTAEPQKVPTPQRGNKVPGKRPGKRGRKQKLTTLVNGEVTEKGSVPEKVSELNREHVFVDADGNSFTMKQLSIKSEPQEQLTQNGLNRNYKGEGTTSKSDDDTLAMQQGYTNLQEHSPEETRTPHHTYNDKCTPPRKRRMYNTHSVENHENEAPLVTPYVKSVAGHEDDAQGIAALSPPWQNPTIPDESFNMAMEQNSPGCSTWCSPVSTNTQQKVRSQRPSNGLQSTAVKRMLSEYLVEPIAQTDCKVCTFRLMWHGSIEELEHVWSRLAYYQEEIDRIITEPAQVALAVSAVTATSTRPKSGSGKLANGTSPIGEVTRAAEQADRGKTFPGLAYWIVLQNEEDFSETDLYNKIYENCFGARLKTLSDKAVASDLQEMCSTLYLVVKDNVDGYVRWKLDSAVPQNGEGEHSYQPVVKVYARAEQDFKTLLMAKEALQKSRFHFSLLKTDT